MYKNLIISLLIIITLITTLGGCKDVNTTTQTIKSKKIVLDDFKGIKVYSIATNDDEYIKLIILNNTIKYILCGKDKTIQTIIMVNGNQHNEKRITTNLILVQNDSVIIKKY